VKVQERVADQRPKRRRYLRVCTAISNILDFDRALPQGDIVRAAFVEMDGTELRVLERLAWNVRFRDAVKKAQAASVTNDCNIVPGEIIGGSSTTLTHFENTNGMYRQMTRQHFFPADPSEVDAK
jgi:hypothetical protein